MERTYPGLARKLRLFSFDSLARVIHESKRAAASLRVPLKTLSWQVTDAFEACASPSSIAFERYAAIRGTLT